MQWINIIHASIARPSSYGFGLTRSSVDLVIHIMINIIITTSDSLVTVAIIDQGTINFGIHCVTIA